MGRAVGNKQLKTDQPDCRVVHPGPLWIGANQGVYEMTNTGKDFLLAEYKASMDVILNIDNRRGVAVVMLHFDPSSVPEILGSS